MRRDERDEDLRLEEVYDLDELHRRYEPAQGDPREELRYQLSAEAFERAWHEVRDRGCRRAVLN